MTLLEIPMVDARPEPERDRWGRYVIPDPETGKKRAWTRATTWAKSCSDTFGLTKWELRMVAVGLARRPDLLTQAATVTDPDNPDAKKLLNSITDDAKEAAGASVRRNLGTALHSFTEQIDAGHEPTIPDAHRADLDAYRARLTEAGITIHPEWIERICLVPGLGVAGTFDRLVTLDGKLMVADLKTGRDVVSYGMGEIAIQLAIYANAATVWDQVTGEHSPMPDVNRERALVIHLPVGEARCELHLVDIAAGWDMAQVCGTVRDWRKRRDLSTPWSTFAAKATVRATVEPPDVPAPTTRDEWIAGRITTLVASRAAKAMLAQHWPDGCPKKAPWTDEQIYAIVPVLERVETAVEAPFPHRDPTMPTAAQVVLAQRAKADEAPVPPRVRPTPDDGGTVSDEDRDALKAAAAKLDADQANRCAAWRAEAKRGGAPWGGAVDGAWTQRCWSDNRAAIMCATHLHDADDPDALTRAALSLVLDETLQSAWSTGAVLGTLTIDQADQLAEIAQAFGASDPDTCARLGERIVAA